MADTTEWFPASVGPVEPGYYETRTDDYPQPMQRKFNLGVWWFLVDDFGLCRSDFANSPGAQWRGLTARTESEGGNNG